MNSSPEMLLELDRVKTYFPVERGLLFPSITGWVKAVDDVSFSVRKGEVFGLVGESGCGKSTLSRTILQLVRPTSGAVRFRGCDLVTLSRKELRSRRADMQMIFQDPYASLNPRMTVYDTLAEASQIRGATAANSVSSDIRKLLDQVGLAQRHIRKYPHEFSGGQRQRIAIARAIATRPELVIADEPVSALDVSVQAQILNLIINLCSERKLTMIFISHDLSVVRHLADRIAVMYLGRIVELGETETVFHDPLHPYTQCLIQAAPNPNPEMQEKRRYPAIQGDPPSPMNSPSGCAFHPRCPIAVDECSVHRPELQPLNPSRLVACPRTAEASAD
jgi:oligopeptide/dipeptide ABC transporter ATP-binding protein